MQVANLLEMITFFVPLSSLFGNPPLLYAAPCIEADPHCGSQLTEGGRRHCESFVREMRMQPTFAQVTGGPAASRGVSTHSAPGCATA